MITRAIVEEVLTPHQVRVRIPLLDRAPETPLATQTANLNIATICTLPSCYINLHVGDVVFVAFEERSPSKVVVLGHLSRDAQTSYADIILNDLRVTARACLPSDTTIGDVTAQDIQCLQGVTNNIQKQLSNLREQQNKLLEAVFGQNPEGGQ